MKKISPILAGLVLAAALVLPTSQGQYPPGYNPFLGGPTPPARFNPFTGPAPVAGQANPLTGAAPAGPVVNPFTGKAAPPGPIYNPLTGGYRAGPAPSQPGLAEASPWPPGEYPVTGKAGPGLEPLDQAVMTMMYRHGIPGASLAIAKDGKLVYAKGIGWADLAGGVPVNPLTAFGLASLSKPLTALAILWLIEHGLLDPDDRVFDILQYLRPPPGGRFNPALKKITIRQCLNHSGGWDRNKSGDPTNWSPQIARTLRVPLPVSDEQFISFMMTQPLDFEPGTQFHYSNVGYILLGKVIEKVSGRGYEQFVRERVLQPAAVRDAFLSVGRRPYRTGEAHCYLAGSNILLPPLELPMLRAAGGWVVSSVGMARVLTALDGSRGRPLLNEKTYRLMLAPPPPPLKHQPDGSYNGMGWPKVTPSPKGLSYAHDGQWYGMRTFMKHSARGVDWVLLFNVTMQPDQVDARVITQAIEEIRQRVEGRDRYPDVDYFADFAG
jgi:CubicO group peptidase (beta-lactamase class C family)